VNEASKRLAGGVLLLAAAACGDKTVVAKVGAESLRQDDLRVFRARQNRAIPETDSLEALVSRAVFAEGAVRAKLLDDPTIQAQIAESKREILAQAIIDRELAKASDDVALRAYYEQHKGELAVRRVHVAQIFARSDGSAPELKAAARNKATAAFSQVKSGEPFAKVASAMSDDTASGSHGGELAPIDEGQVDAAFFRTAFALKKGEVSPPFETPFGYHVLMAIDEPAVVAPTFDQAKSRVAVEARRQAEAVLTLRLKADISIRKYPERLSGKGER
jgi:peptidyl-prolyl cis-trans isomerase C